MCCKQRTFRGSFINSAGFALYQLTPVPDVSPLQPAFSVAGCPQPWAATGSAARRIHPVELRADDQRGNRGVIMATCQTTAWGN